MMLFGAISVGVLIVCAGAIFAIRFAALQERAQRGRASEADELYRLVSGATTDAIYEWDPSRNVLTGNAGLAECFGLQWDAEAPGTAEKWLTRVHPDDVARVRRQMIEVLAGSGTFWSAEYRFRRANGTYAYTMDRAFVARDDEGLARRVIGAMTDVTETRRAEAVRVLRLAVTAALGASSSFDAALPELLRAMCTSLDLRFGNA